MELDISIVTETGAEAITGSTRMKAGSAHKMVLNMISTCVMIKMGNVYQNLMINVKPTNIKLKRRVISIVCEILECNEDEAVRMLDKLTASRLLFDPFASDTATGSDVFLQSILPPFRLAGVPWIEYEIKKR